MHKSVTPIHILCCADDAYAPYCGIMLTSLLHNLPHKGNPRDERYRAVIHIVSTDIGADNREKFRCLEERYLCRIEFITPAPSLLSRLPEAVNGWPIASYLRLIATEILPVELHRVIYLDSDIAVDSSVASLWEAELGGKACAVICDAPSPCDCTPRKERCGIKGTYFNSGVMVIDLDKFRQLGIASRSVEMLSTLPPEYECPDQDILNILLDVNHIDLPARWNVQTCHFQSMCPDPEGEELAEVIGVARGKLKGIIHYTTMHKPWRNEVTDFHPMEHVWRRYRKLSPWAETPLTPPTLPLRTKLARLRHTWAFRLGLPSAYLSAWKRI